MREDSVRKIGFTAAFLAFGTVAACVNAVKFTKADFIPLPTTNSPVNVFAGDFNADGKTDIAVLSADTSGRISSVQLAKNTSTNSAYSFSFGTPTAISGATLNTGTVVDVDSDGFPDLALASTGGTAPAPNFGISVFMNWRLYGASERTLNYSLWLDTGEFALNTDSGGANPAFLIAKDLNGDNKVDLVVAYNRNNSNYNFDKAFIVTFINTSSPAGMSFARGTKLELRSPVYAIDAADFDRNGLNDLAVIVHNTGLIAGSHLQIFSNDATTAMFTANPSQEIDLQSSFSNHLYAFDLNGDGAADLMVSAATTDALGTTVKLFQANTEPVAPVGFLFEKQAMFTPGSEIQNSFMEFLPDDFNNDGQTDLAIVGAPIALPGLVIFENEKNIFTSRLQEQSYALTSLQSANFDSDTFKDIVGIEYNYESQRYGLRIMRNESGT